MYHIDTVGVRHFRLPSPPLDPQLATHQALNIVRGFAQHDHHLPLVFDVDSRPFTFVHSLARLLYSPSLVALPRFAKRAQSL